MTEQNEKQVQIEAQIADIIAGRPLPFKVCGIWYYIYPPTLGRQQLLAHLIPMLDLHAGTLKENLYLEALRVASIHKDVAIEIIALATCKTKEEAFDYPALQQKKELLQEHIGTEDIATLLVAILSADQTEIFSHHLGIDKETERLNKVLKLKSKDDKNSISFGGLSVFGTLLDAACERYGWTYDYCTWGISLPALRLMLADKVQSVYLTDKERKKIPAYLLNSNKNENVIRADDPKNKETIRAMNWK